MKRPEGMSFEEVCQSVLVLYGDRNMWLAEALQNALTDAMKKATISNKKAVVSLKIVVDPGHGNTMMIAPDLEVKGSKVKPTATPLFRDNKGGLHAQDPNQPALPGCEVPSNVIQMGGQK